VRPNPRPITSGAMVALVSDVGRGGRVMVDHIFIAGGI
jgi:hypothetical protein